MNGYMLYLQYMKPGSEYFSKMKVIERDTEYELKGVLADRQLIFNELELQVNSWETFLNKNYMIMKNGKGYRDWNAPLKVDW